MKKNNIRKNAGIVSLFFFLILTACTGNFDDLNKHAIDPRPSDLTEAERVGIYFPRIIQFIHPLQENESQHMDQMVGGQYGGYMATTNNWQGTNFGTFNPAKDWADYIFNTMFVGFYSNYNKIQEETNADVDSPIYSWANIIKAAVILKVVDTYGPIPHSEMGKGLLQVKYDGVQEIYHSLIEDLKNSAETLIKGGFTEGGSNKSLAQFDILFNGDFNKWVKYANSLRLRMAVRIANVDTEYAKAVMNDAINAGTIESNADNAYIQTNDNPYAKASSNWNDLAVSATLSAYMDGYKDPRTSVYITPASGKYTGVRMGIANIEKNIYGNGNYYSKLNFKPDSPLLVYCAAETAFLKAEAALRGWIPGGDSMAKAYYEEGIKLSMEQHGVSIGNYLAGTTSPSPYTDPINSSNNISVRNAITVAWDDFGTTQNSKLEKIITQKWLANYPLGFEAWCDHRRTGFPQFFPAASNLSSGSTLGTIANNSNRLVRRLPYPQLEYQGNNENVTEAVATLLGGGDTGSTDLWWAKKN